MADQGKKPVTNPPKPAGSKSPPKPAPSTPMGKSTAAKGPNKK